MRTGFIIFAALGIFAGNFLYNWLVNKDRQRGFWVGLIAATIFAAGASVLLPLT